jgi:bifunctional DNase/RNase
MKRKASSPAVILLTAILLASIMGPAAEASQAQEPSGAMYEMEVLGVQADPASGNPLVFLRGKQDKRELSMIIGPMEAQGILLPLQGMRLPRPYTHDLMLETIHRLKAKVKRVIITEMRDNTYFASLILDSQGQEVVLDSRPSDAIALALRENAPILAAERAFIRPQRPPRAEPGERGRP